MVGPDLVQVGFAQGLAAQACGVPPPVSVGDVVLTVGAGQQLTGQHVGGGGRIDVHGGRVQLGMLVAEGAHQPAHSRLPQVRDVAGAHALRTVSDGPQAGRAGVPGGQQRLDDLGQETADSLPGAVRCRARAGVFSAGEDHHHFGRAAAVQQVGQCGLPRPLAVRCAQHCDGARPVLGAQGCGQVACGGAGPRGVQEQPVAAGEGGGRRQGRGSPPWLEQAAVKGVLGRLGRAPHVLEAAQFSQDVAVRVQEVDVGRARLLFGLFQAYVAVASLHRVTVDGDVGQPHGEQHPFAEAASGHPGCYARLAADVHRHRVRVHLARLPARRVGQADLGEQAHGLAGVAVPDRDQPGEGRAVLQTEVVPQACIHPFHCDVVRVPGRQLVDVLSAGRCRLSAQPGSGMDGVRPLAARYAHLPPGTVVAVLACVAGDLGRFGQRYQVP
ncbi:hypothetical protein SRIMM317S_02508 [Streptomyces rimosus subsp. rimosus]